jgi:hypothetical protein
MTNTPIERACRAVAEALNKLDSDAKSPWDEEDTKLLVRAVLQAIREPSEAMLRAAVGDRPLTYQDGGRSDMEMWADRWRDMVDILLAEVDRPADPPSPELLAFLDSIAVKRTKP